MKYVSTKHGKISVDHLDVVWGCVICAEVFSSEVWHCTGCDHHWLMHRDQCWNCYKDRVEDVDRVAIRLDDF